VDAATAANEESDSEDPTAANEESDPEDPTAANEESDPENPTAVPGEWIIIDEECYSEDSITEHDGEPDPDDDESEIIVIDEDENKESDEQNGEPASENPVADPNVGPMIFCFAKWHFPFQKNYAFCFFPFQSKCYLYRTKIAH
jgi:hypothetical protein